MQRLDKLMIAALLFLTVIVAWMVMALAGAHARDFGQWNGGDPAIKEWFETLMQPDNPRASCCGEADAYWCDEIHVRDGKTYCNITDDRVIAKRTPAPLGLEIEIPDNKLKWDKGNPTGHSIVFLSSGLTYVYCFVQNGGV